MSFSPPVSPIPPPTPPPPPLADINSSIFISDLPWILPIVIATLLIATVLNCRRHPPETSETTAAGATRGCAPDRSQLPPQRHDKKRSIASVTFTYKPRPPPAEEAKSCAICLEDLKSGEDCSRVVKCGHEYHKGCIDLWFTRDKHCPLCRGSVRGASVRDDNHNLDHIV